MTVSDSTGSPSDEFAALSQPREIDTAAAMNRVRRMLTVPGISCQERAIADAVIAELNQLGVPAEAVSFDDAHTKTVRPGEVGNLIVKLPGTLDRPTRLFSAHLDTVPLAEGCQPAEDDQFLRAGGNGRGLGADNRSGVAVLLTAIAELSRQNLPHGPLTFIWFVQEEIGLHGARHLDVAQVGEVGAAFNYDGGDVAKITTGATGAYRIASEWTGRAAHAGGAPEKGASALTAAALAIARLHEGGWLGKVEKEAGNGTANVGIFQAGAATNVVTDRATLRTEVRSHDSVFRDLMRDNFRATCEQAASEVRTLDGAPVTVAIEESLDYDSFRLPADCVSVKLAEAAVKSLGREPVLYVSNGGLDANWLFKHGIAAVTLGCGQVSPHTIDEQLEKRDYLDACRLAVTLATMAE